MPCYDVGRLKTKSHVGLGPGESKEYTKHRVSLECHSWPGCHPVSYTWHPYSYGQTKQKRATDVWPLTHPEEAGARILYLQLDVKATEAEGWMRDE